MPMIKPMIVTVTQLVRKIGYMFREEKNFQDICVRGEISDCKLNAKTGFIFFTLKDSGALIKAVVRRWDIPKLTVSPETGMQAVVRGTVKCYEPGGIFQLEVIDVQAEGTGVSAAEAEQIKERLRSEGLFDRKRKLPEMPKKICIITSETGEVIHDLLTNIERRCPVVKVLFIPASVQGADAPSSLISALRAANRTDAEVIIFGRGGGSQEDLAAFNDEALAREIFASRIPTISAVGHDKNEPIVNFVADLSVSTPSVAAERAVPDIFGKIGELEERKQRVGIKLSRVVERKIAAVRILDERIRGKNPVQRLASDEQKLDRVSERINARMERILGAKEQECDIVYKKLQMRVHTVTDVKERSLMHTAAVIKALDPLAVLLRGYSITYSGGKALVNTDGVNAGDRLRIRLSDGTINAVVESTEKE